MYLAPFVKQSRGTWRVYACMYIWKCSHVVVYLEQKAFFFVFYIEKDTTGNVYIIVPRDARFEI